MFIRGYYISIITKVKPINKNLCDTYYNSILTQLSMMK